MPPKILKRFGGTFPTNTDSDDLCAFCAWYFAICAHKTLLEIPEQVSMEGDTDATVSLRRILDSLLMVYGLEDEIEKVMKMMPYARQHAFKTNLNWSSRFQGWLDSGGRAYNEVTREPPK